MSSLEYKVVRITNTYECIIATAASSISSRICAVISTVRIVWLTDGPLFPSSVNCRCPSIMFAVRRIASVSGRIRLLTVPVITMNGIGIFDVPWGTKCSNMCFVFFHLLTHL